MPPYATLLIILGVVGLLVLVFKVIGHINNYKELLHEKDTLRKQLESQFEQEYQNKVAVLTEDFNLKKKDLVERYNNFVKKEKDNLENGRREIMRSYIPSQGSYRFARAFLSDRGYKALTENIVFNDLSCTTTSSDGQTKYTTTLFSCTCPDFTQRNTICKHMIALAIRTGEFDINHVREVEHEQFISFESSYMQKTFDLEQAYERINLKCKQKQNELDKKSLRIEEYSNELADIKKQISSAKKSRDLSFPWLANQFAELEYKQDHEKFDSLKLFAKKSRDIVKMISDEKKELVIKSKLLENTLLAYEYLFPWLEEFKTVSIKDALQYVSAASDSEEYESSLRKWLSPEEYSCLSDTQKNQLALERYQSRNKTDWEIGIEYERYIGYLYETNGYNVRYIGATEGVNDMGRDLIAEKDNTVYIIQCKRWSTEKQIHEKHIFQLFGTTYILNLDETKKKFIPVFYTTTYLSDVAEKCATGLDIEVHQNFEYKDFPMIKCNIGKDENGNLTKIYHLPFDQQYDRVRIGALDGECYVSRVSEAEEKGFRRAYRWRGNN